MRIVTKVLFYFLKFRNFTYFEITIKDRVSLFYNHLINTIKVNIRPVAIKEVVLGRTYVISLNFRSDRRTSIKAQFSATTLNFSFVDAELFDNSKNSQKYFSTKSLRYLSYGAMGCALSHIKLWEEIASDDQDKYHLIFEDDVIIDSSFQNSLIHLLKTYPSDADIFFLGTRNERPRDILFLSHFNYCRSFNCRLGAFAYIISGKSAKKILNTILPVNLLCGGIDTALGINIRRKKLIAYQMNPSIISHNNNLSSNIYNPSALKKNLHPLTMKSWPNIKRYSKPERCSSCTSY